MSIQVIDALNPYDENEFNSVLQTITITQFTKLQKQKLS